MRVKFLKSCEIEVCTNVDKFDNAMTETEVFEVGDETEFEIIDHPTDIQGREDLSHVNVQFGDGSVAFGLSTEWFKQLFICG